MLTDADKERARYHLGYMEVVVASSFAFAIPQATELQFMFESAITRVRPEAEFRVRAILDKPDSRHREGQARHGCRCSRRRRSRAQSVSS